MTSSRPTCQHWGGSCSDTSAAQRNVNRRRATRMESAREGSNMSAASAASTTGQDLARNMSLFQIDEALTALVESAHEEAAANGGDLSEQLRAALADYVEAFGEKVDRIANYLKAQESFAELAKREEERLYARRKSAENRVKGLKSFLSFWMLSKGLKHLKGRLNTITLSKNSVDTLIVEEQASIPDRYHKVTVQMSWDEWAIML